MKTVKILTPLSFIIIFIFSFVAGLAAQEIKPVPEVKSDALRQINQPPPTAATPPASSTQTSAIKRNDERYRIGLQDVLEITVYKHPELSQPNIRMDETGRIRLPRVNGSILAICKTENELAGEIINLYKENYLRDPYVTVYVKEQNSQPLSVIGAVQKPGNFFTNRRLTLLELLSFAGGQNVEKAGTKIRVARVGGVSGCKVESDAELAAADDANGITFFEYELNDVLKGKTNPFMRPGDIVNIPESEQAYVIGNVNKPQPIQLKQAITLTQAIAAAGGVLAATKKSQVRIVRQESGTAVKQELIYDLNAINDRKIPDPFLQANDIVEVPTDKVKNFTNSFVQAITGGAANLFYRIP